MAQAHGVTQEAEHRVVVAKGLVEAEETAMARDHRMDPGGLAAGGMVRVADAGRAAAHLVPTGRFPTSTA